MISLARSASMIGLVAGAMSLAGCATQQAVEHAQTTADQAMAQAQAAMSAAQKAQSTADKANARLDTVEPDVDHLAHHHEHGTMDDVGVKHPPHKRMPKHAETTPSSPQ